ncbi:MAG TPA: UDP-N-acetylmuramoyl-L-alanine--D-glutamate ligase [Pirellulales bacterium]|nr:UDP-N-acetylmuramoyl-L-alanine--D-glutamate ligase [Pirellulales bacterium]
MSAFRRFAAGYPPRPDLFRPTKVKMANEFQGKHVTVMGLGRHGGGLSAVRYLVRAGAIVRVTDCASPLDLHDVVAQLTDLPVAELHFGKHRIEHFADADLVVVNPAVRPTSPFVKAAAAEGIHVTSEIELFLQRCPARIVGVTGSCGKSTTAAMLAEIGKTSGRCVWLGGNIERSLLPELDSIARDDLVVLELSSFQLAWLNPDARRPDIVVITNCEPNHLDWHGTYDDYVAAKREIFDPQRGNQVVVLGPDLCSGDWIRNEATRVVDGWPLDRIPRLQVLGIHNRRNAALAAAAATAFGFPRQAVEEGLRQFQGLPHRLESAGTIAGRQFINDSQATTPAATSAALASVDGPCWLLAGGASKGASLADLAATIRRQCRGAAFFGETGNELQAAVRQFAPDFDTASVPRLVDAVQALWPKTRPGDVILLSPACSSRDQYLDYAQRADDFRAAMRQIAAQHGGSATRHQVAPGLV